MDSAGLITEEYKNQIYGELLDALLAGIETGSTPEEAAQESSGFILDGLENVKNNNDLVAFLEELSARWPIFHDVFLKTKEIQLEKIDDQKIETAREQIQNLTN